MNCQNTFQTVYDLLQCYQPTTALVERCFSMLNKLLAKNQNFRPENEGHYNVRALQFKH